jgi:exopolysaccharide biosynthesis polyprenyl glycosylphosphotransferase
MDAKSRDILNTGGFVGKIFPDASTVAVPARNWRFGLLRRIFPHALLVCDLLLITAIFSLMVFIRHGEFASALISQKVLLTLMVTSVFGCYLVGGYSFRTKKNSARFVSEHILVSFFVGITVISITYGFVAYGNGVGASRGSVIPTLLLFPLCSVLYRYRLELVKSRRRSKRAICILGASGRSLDLVESISKEGHGEDVFVFDDCVGLEHGSNDKVAQVLQEHGARMLPLSDYDPMSDTIRGCKIDTIILAMRLEEMPEAMVKSLICSHSISNQVVTLESFVLKTFKYVPIHQVSPSWAFGEGFRINSSLVYNRAKRMLDFSGALLGLVVASPFLLATALAVKLTSKGTVFFSQERIGRHEVPFTLYKFRTMVEGADKHGDYTAEKDSRITAIGNFLRKSRLDEIPQLWNVLKGDMSLVGPRPEWSKLVEDYEGKVRLYHYRHLVRPGITGWAQVCYPYGASVEDAVQKMKYDLYYVRYYSLVLDLTIVVKTAYTMIFGRGR